jgi:hypothetical protein
MANILRSEFHNGLLDQGQRSEVVVRQLLSEAYRRAMRKDHSQPNCSKGCKLIAFVSQLFSTDCANQILNSVPDNLKSSTTFADAFEDAIIRFTHFAKMADNVGTTTHAMFAAFVRYVAIICWSSQNIIDLLIHVLFKSGETLQESVMMGLLIQVKQRKAKGSVIRYKINQKALGFFPAPADSTEDMRSYVTLVAEVGVQLPISPGAITETKVGDKLTRSVLDLLTLETPRKPTAVKPPTTATPSKLHIPTQPCRISHPRDVHPRYSIFSYGCSDTVYNVISHCDRSVYKFLLGNRGILDEHPRTDAKSLSAVRAMKPFWRAGLDCYRWTEELFLRKCQDWHDDDIVGQYDSETDQSPIM